MGFFSKLFKAITKPLRTVLGWLMPIPGQPEAAAVMVEKQGSDNPIPVVYGTRRIGGIKVHKYVTDASGGASNEYLHLIIALCEGPIDSVVEVFFDGESENDAKWNKKGGGKWFTIERHLGDADQLASASAVSQIPNWTSAHRMRGLAYLYVRVQMDKDQSIWRGEPAITATVRGKTILDPRTGITGYSENPALQLLDYLTDSVYGKGLPLSRLNQQSFLNQADLADQPLVSSVTINEITTALSHNRFTSNAVIDTSQSVFNNVKKLLSGMRGLLPIGSGFIRLEIETTGTPQFYFAHDTAGAANTALITSNIKTTSGKKSDRYNRVIVRFPNINTEFENDEIFYPAADNSLAQQWLDEDNGIRLEQSFEFQTITNKAEAYQMAEIIAKRSRNRLECSFDASPESIVVEPGDIVGITDGTRGWDKKPFRVDRVKLKDDGDCSFDFIEHQNAIYPWSGTSYSERVGGTNLGDPSNIPAPTGLSIAPDPTFATAGRLTWSAANNAFIRRYRVNIESGGVTYFSEETFTPVIELPLLSPGNYTVSVYAVSTIGTLSPAAAIVFELNQPIAPTSITLTPSNFEIEAKPVLAGAGLGTSFEFDIVAGNGTGYTPAVKSRGASAVFVGLQHGTQYTVFARTINALGISDWVNRTGATTSNAADIIDLIGDPLYESVFQPVVDDLQQKVDAVTDSVEDLGNDLKVQVNKIRLDTENAEIEVLRTTALAQQVRQGQSDLTNAIFYYDVETGQIVNRAYAYTDNQFTQANLLIDGVRGEVDINTQRVTVAENRITNAEAQILVQAGQIDLKASYTDVNSAIASAIDAILPAYSFGFFDSAEGWSAVNGTLTVGVSKINVTWGDIQNQTLNYLADDNPIISITVERTGGSAWVGDVIVSYDGAPDQTYSAVIESVTAGAPMTRTLNLAGEPTYVGTVTGLRFKLGATVVDTFAISMITIGKPSANYAAIEGLTAQVNQVGIDLNAIEGQLTNYVTTAYYNDNTVTLGNFELNLNGVDGYINLLALQQTLDAEGTITKANSAAVWVDAAQANITQVVESYNAQPNGINDTFVAVQQELDAVDGRITSQVVAISDLNNEARDIELNALLAEYALYQRRKGELELGAGVATAQQSISALSGETQAIAQSVLDLNAAFGTAQGQANANYQAVNQAMADEAGARVAAIQNLTASIADDFAAQSQLIQNVDARVDGNVDALAALETRVGGAEDFSAAQLILNSEYDNELGVLSSRAYLGVSSVSGGVATSTGVVFDGATQGIAFKGKAFSLVTPTDQPVLYWTDAEQVLNIKARVVLEDGFTVTGESDIRALDGTDGRTIYTEYQYSVDGTSAWHATYATGDIFRRERVVTDGVGGAWSAAARITGIKGDTGAAGATGAGFYGSAYAAISWTTATANDRFNTLVGRLPVKGDIFTQTRTDGTDSQARQYSGSAWGTVALQVNGSIVASGTIAGDKLIAGTSITAPVITGGAIRMIGATAMSIESQTPFGPHNLLEWKGKKVNGVNWNTSTSQPILSGLTKSNASYYYSANDEVYFAGSILAGTLRNAVQTTILTAAPSVESGSFGSNGGLITIKCGFSASRSELGSGACPVHGNPSGTMYLDRWNGSAWIQVASQVMNGEYLCTVEGGEYIAGWDMASSLTYSDTQYATTNRLYRLRATHNLPLLPNGNLRLSLITEE